MIIERLLDLDPQGEIEVPEPEFPEPLPQDKGKPGIPQPKGKDAWA